MKLISCVSVAAACVAGTLGLAPGANAQAPAPAAPAPAPAPAAAPAAPSTAISLPWGISMTGHAEAGVNGNPDDPSNNVNFGQTLTDRANGFALHQAVLNVERDMDPKTNDYQWGFKFTGVYGTDARVTHFYNEFDRVTNSPYQWDVWEADAQIHLPTYGNGTDIKIGQYPTPLGYEVMDATGNFFFTHSYIFQYGLPFKHTGVLATAHVSDTVDLWLGIDTGANNSIGAKGMVNNAFPKALFGVGLNGLMGGNLTILALAHIGPEYPDIVEPAGGGAPFLFSGANSKTRIFADIVTTYTWSDNLSLANELNMIHQDGFTSVIGAAPTPPATGGGVAQYAIYKINDQWSAGIRGEVFADQNGAFVCTAQGSLDYTDSARGLQPNFGYCSGNGPSGGTGDVTYGAITIGANWKPNLPMNMGNYAYLTLRPEARMDTVIGGGHVHPFDVGSNGIGTKTTQYTLSLDAIIGF